MFPASFFQRSAQIHSNRIAIEHDGASVSYEALRRSVDALAAAMQHTVGIHRLTVAIVAVNSLDCLSAVLAVHIGGGVLVPLNPKNGTAELTRQIETARPDIIIADHTCLTKFSAAAGIPIVVAGVAEHASYPTVAQLIDRFLGRSPVWPDVGLADASAIKFTGGSSGRPKGVVQPFRCINTLVANMLATFRFDETDVYVCAAPLTHGAGTFILPILAAGGKVVMLTTPTTDRLVDTLESCRATTTWVPPTMLYALTEEQRARPRNLTCLKRLIYGGAPSAPEKIRDAVCVFGPVLAAVYGQTEAPVMLTAMTAEELAAGERYSSAGRACMLSEVAIMSPEGLTLPAGESGEVVTRGDLLMTGYLDMPQETAETIVKGWLHTGDVGYFDEQGYLHIKDRIRDVIISGGFNVYPSDVEAALSCHSAVHECVVFGVADDKWGERVEAAVEIRESVTESALIAFAKEVLGSVKAPKRIHILQTLPRSPAGKVLRREAKALLAP